ncbi:MAG: DUF1549 domain-containing protein [Verrucomicrobiota bacterium]
MKSLLSGYCSPNALLLTLLTAGLSLAFCFQEILAEEREWRVIDGDTIVGQFQSMQGDEVLFKDWAGDVIRVRIEQLHPEDQNAVQTAFRNRLSNAVKRIDMAVDEALKARNITPNPIATDEQFLRRIYLDVTGTIPTYDEAVEFLKSTDPRKRPRLVARLMNSDGYTSHTYNYFADLLRIQDQVPGTFLSMDAYADWLKRNLQDNRPFDQLVHEMVGASGRIWEDPAVGFYLRDYDAPLDHVQYTAKTFLGTDISCAQCHDDPFQDWTQMDYYQFSQFMGKVETEIDFNRPLAAGADEAIENEIIKRHNLKDLDTPEGRNRLRQVKRNYSQPIGWMRDATRMAVTETRKTKFPLPETYKYEDGSPGDVPAPRVLFGKNPASLESGKSEREVFAGWLTAPENPRFALNIANRMWERYFGRGVLMPLHNIEPETADIPELVDILAEEMVALGFDLKLFGQVVLNTKAYQRVATREKVNDSDPYFFQGPLLRRMSAEQVWDSLITLMTQEPLRFRKGNGRYYNATMNLSSVDGPMTPKEYFERVDAYRKYEGALGNYIDTRKIDSAEFAEASPVVPTTMEGDSMSGRRRMKGIPGLSYGSLLLTRASELPQPTDPSHFLRMFGQSERNFIVDASSKGGSVPQVMEMMNGFATTALTSPNSAIFQKMGSTRDRMQRADIVFLSILNRKSYPYERSLIYDELDRFKGGSDGYSNLIWALLNTPEFFFIR